MSNEINALRKKVGQRWFKLAVKWVSFKPSYRDRMAAVKSMHPKHGGSAKNIGGIKATLDQLDDLRDDIKRIRVAKKRHIYTPYVEEKTTPEQRLRARVMLLVKVAVWSVTRSPERDEVRVIISDDPKDLGMEVSEDFCRPYGGSFKTWSAKEYIRRVTVPRRYLSRVHKPGLTTIGGMLTLDATPVDSPVHGVRLYAATWLVASRGFEHKTVHGFIGVSDNGENFHGKTVASTIRGVLARVQTPEEKAEISRKRFKTRLKNIAERSNGTLYTMRDAEALGFCDYGIRSWCNRVGLDPEGQATMKEIVDAYFEAPVEEARKFILYYSKK